MNISSILTKHPKYIPINTTAKQSIASCIYRKYVKQQIIGLMVDTFSFVHCPQTWA